MQHTDDDWQHHHDNTNRHQQFMVTITIQAATHSDNLSGWLDEYLVDRSRWQHFGMNHNPLPRADPIRNSLINFDLKSIIVLIEAPARSRNHPPSQWCTHTLDRYQDSMDINHRPESVSCGRWLLASCRHDARHVGQLRHHAMPAPWVWACTEMTSRPLRVSPSPALQPPANARAPKPRARLDPAMCCVDSLPRGCWWSPRGCSTWPQGNPPDVRTYLRQMVEKHAYHVCLHTCAEKNGTGHGTASGMPMNPRVGRDACSTCSYRGVTCLWPTQES